MPSMRIFELAAPLALEIVDHLDLVLDVEIYLEPVFEPYGEVVAVRVKIKTLRVLVKLVAHNLLKV